MPHGSLNAPIRADLRGFFASGVTGAALARNPERNIGIARALQRDIKRQLQASGSVSRIETGPSEFQGSSFAFDFFNEEERLRQSFIDQEIERSFGPQNAVQTSTVGPGGVRRPVAGQQVLRTPTSAQLAGIRRSFKTPLERELAHLPPGQQTRSGITGGADSPTARPRTPTVVTSGGVRRRRPRAERRATILTSDDEPIGGRTLLG